MAAAQGFVRRTPRSPAEVSRRLVEVGIDPEEMRACFQALWEQRDDGSIEPRDHAAWSAGVIDGMLMCAAAFRAALIREGWQPPSR